MPASPSNVSACSCRISRARSTVSRSRCSSGPRPTRGVDTPCSPRSTLASLRSQIGVVSQDVVLFDDTVRANIAFARPDADWSTIERAARLAGAHDFVERLPDGYDTVLVVDFGAQYAQLIARRVREAHVYSEIVSRRMPVAEMLERKPKAIIFSGGPSSVYADGAPTIDPAIYDAGVPILGICYGGQLMARDLGGEVAHTGSGEYGRAGLTVSSGVSTLLFSKMAILGVISSVGLTMFPFILPSSIDPHSSLTAWNASSSHLTLWIMLLATLVLLPLVLAYTAWAVKVMFGRVTLADVRTNPDFY